RPDRRGGAARARRGRGAAAAARRGAGGPAAQHQGLLVVPSRALVYALVAALGNVIGALAVTRRAARGLAVIEHFVAFGAGFMLAVAVVELLPEAFARSGA